MITVQQFEFEGNAQVPSGILSMLTADYTGRPLSRAMLDQAAAKVAAFYQRRGFARASVLVPEQDFNSGTVRLAVTEVGQRPTAVVPLAGADAASPSPAATAVPAVSAPAPVDDIAEEKQVSTITIERFEFEGNQLFPAEQLAAVVAPFTNKPISVAEVYEAADAVGRFYAKHGYKLASVAVPAQKVNEGSVRLKVIEGQIAAVKYEGLRRYKAADLDAYVSDTANRPYEAEVFEGKLRRMDALPGLDVRARLQPGSTFGTSDLVILARETPLQGSVFVDNAGTQNIGVLRGGVQLALNSPLGFADQLSVLALRSEGGLLNYGSVSYSLPTGLNGGRIGVTYGDARFDVGGPFAGIGGSNRNVRGEFQLPVLADTASELNLSTAISHVSADTDFAGITFNQSNVTLAELAGRYSRKHGNRAITQAALVLGSNFASEKKADSLSKVPLKIDLDVQRSLPLPYAMQLLTRAQFVYSIDSLPETQKYALGGPGSLRAYAPAETRGDWGYLGQLTLQRNYFIGPAQLAPRLFYDVGAVRQHRNQQLPVNARPPDVALAGYGIGADAAYRRFNLKLDYSIPLLDAPASDGEDDGRFYGTFSLSF